ncbi:MAG: c-type cytochrome [bacterium]|nr:c-type cytochrome [bacterium]
MRRRRLQRWREYLRGRPREAHDIFQTRCATCHGQFGRGDGPGAAALNPKPQNYADAAWQQKVTDAEIEKAIVFGGASVGKSAQMVPNPDLEAKPGVVAALRRRCGRSGSSEHHHFASISVISFTVTVSSRTSTMMPN